MHTFRAKARQEALIEYAADLGKRTKRPAPYVPTHMSDMQSLGQLAQRSAAAAKAKVQAKRHSAPGSDQRLAKRQKKMEQLIADHSQLYGVVSVSFFTDILTNAPGPGECSFLSGALQVQKSNAVYMAQRRTNSEVHATLHAQEFQCQRLSIFVALIGVLVRQQWLCLSRQDVAAFFLACASTFRPLRGNSLAALPQILSVGTFQKVQLQVRGTMQHSIPKACIHTANALEDVARMCRILRENFEQKVLSNAAWLIPEEVLLALDTCFNFEKYFAQPTPELDRSRCNAFATLAAYVKHRWPFAFPGELPAHALTGQYQKMLQHWWQLAKAPKLWLNGRLLWNEFWEATHAQQRFFVENTREAFFIWHAMGSIQSSEAACESIASQLKKYASTGCRAGRAVEKAILREADVSFSDEFILRTFAEVKKPLRFHCVRHKRREALFPLGKGSKTLHVYFSKFVKKWSFQRIRALAAVGAQRRQTARAWERRAQKVLPKYG